MGNITMMIKNKKAELTTAQLVTIIVLIVSFIIILFLIFRLNPGEQTNKEICHNSVVLKAKSVGLAGPLDCRTNYLCISGGDDCAESRASKVEVDSDNKIQIMEALAKEMSDCWYMFGEGKINYGASGGKSVKYALCSVVEFDAKIQEKTSEISYIEFYEYLRQTKKTGSQSYLNYFYGVNEVSSLTVETQFKVNIASDKINTEEKYSIITGVDDNFFTSDETLKVYIIPTSETTLRLAGDREFITKA